MRSARMKALVTGVACALMAALGFQLLGPGFANQAQAQSSKARPAATSTTSTTPLGLVNKGPIDPKTWKYGPRDNPPPNAQIWNPVKRDLLAGKDIVGGTVSSVDPNDYCAEANAGYNFTWTEIQHGSASWNQVENMWAACPHAKAVPGARVAPVPDARRDIQHATDEGAMVIIVPQVDTVKEAKQAVDWTYFPPLGQRSNGGGPAFGDSFWGSEPGGYRNTYNQNVVLIVMIESVKGAMNAAKIARVPGVDAVFAASSDLGSFSGYQEGDADYEKLVKAVHDAALGAGKKLCGPLKWINRPGFTCFQGNNDAGLIAQGAKDELSGAGTGAPPS